MAFPTIQTADTKNGTVTSNSSSWTLTYPTNLANGDLILAFVAADGAPSFSWPAGWIRRDTNATAVAMAMAWKISDGTETSTFTLTLGASEQGGWRIFRITGWFGSGIPTSGNWTAQVNADGTALAAPAQGTNAAPDPGSLNPANWDVEDTLWFAGCAVDTSRTISVWPLADNQTADVSGGAGGATLGLCTINSAVSSLDPGTFTISASDDWLAATVAVRPAATAAQIFDTQQDSLHDDPFSLQVVTAQAVTRASVY